ncbi:kinase-like domain-containing protein [Aspergillus ambiguus]|uniref:kinase-like domain-containing protein n=1 Tax=Aspergillus ambiguus TaxID=176160 RepID=UPI003CCE210F
MYALLLGYTHCILYGPIEGVERLEGYRPGDYHPIQIGDRFHGRYRIVHKLGHGSYSTLWLTRDEQAQRYTPHEFDILSNLTGPQCALAHSPDKIMVPSILDKFHVQGQNGNHICYITAPDRGSLSEIKDCSRIRLFQIPVARALAAQLVLVVDCLHAQGIVHGDLHMGNVLLKIPTGFDQLSPELDPVVHIESKPLPPNIPTHGIAPLLLGKASENITLNEARILLTDFGEAFPYTKELKYESHTPLPIRPPEDIWTLAYTIWDIIAQRPLFEPLENRFEDSVQEPRQDARLPLFDPEEREAIFEMLRPCLIQARESSIYQGNSGV